MQTDARDESTVCSEETVSTLAEEDEELREPDTTSQAESHPLDIDDGGKEEEEVEGEGPGNEESPVCMSRTACGDFHNLACDTAGQAYSLPSPITFSSFPGGAQQRVVDVACGKEHCMLLTEHGQVLHSTRRINPLIQLMHVCPTLRKGERGKNEFFGCCSSYTWLGLYMGWWQ